MVVEGSPIRDHARWAQGRRLGGWASRRDERPGPLSAAAYAVAILAVVPLLAPEVWGGFRLGLADPVLSAVTTLEQPLSVRSPGGVWAVGVCLSWFGLACWRREFAVWEAALVIVGGAAALARAGNLWLDALALLFPLARQVANARLNVAALSAIAAVCLLGASYSLVQTRPPELPVAAVEAVRLAPRQGKVLADWRWAAELQRQLGTDREVLASRGAVAESGTFWLDYLRIVQGHERWADLLRQLEVGTVVLNPDGQQHRAAELIGSSSEWRVIYESGQALVAVRVA